MDERQEREQQLAVMEALCAAQERWPEVMRAVAAAADREDAAARVVELLGLSDRSAADAVLDLEVVHWTVQERRRTAQWRDELRRQVDAVAPAAADVDWDAVYAGAEQVWSGDPNGVLVAEAAGLRPGTAVDVGCGEGADAIWLAQQGWQVTAFDVSATALARAAEHVAAAGVTVELRHAGLLDAAPSLGRFDLVNVQYPALLHEQGRSLAAVLDLVAPGGTLLFVHHALSDGEHAQRAGFDPADYVLPADARAALDDGWEVVVHEQRPRRVTSGAGAHHTADVVLRARRLAG